MKKDIVTTTIRMDKKLHDLLFQEVRWNEKKSVGRMMIEAIKQYLTNLGYKIE